MLHRLLTTLDGKPFAAPGARITNAMRRYFTFEFGPYPKAPFGLLARPVSLTLIGATGPQLTVTGITRSATGMLAGHSLAGLLDVAPRSHRFETAAPPQILAVLKKGYAVPPVIECTVTSDANKPIEQHEQTDFAFMSHAIPEALMYDTGEKYRIVSRADHAVAVVPADLPGGPGHWSADVSHVALSAAAHGFDPGEPVRAEVTESEGLTGHPELALFLDDVKRFRAMIPVAKFLTTGRSAEGLRKRLTRAFREQLAHALSYEFRTQNGAIGVGTRVTGVTAGALVVVATEAHFVDGEFIQTVTAVPEPLAPHWGHTGAPQADALVLATVAEGTDPQHLGRVPIVFADQPRQIVWARAAAPHAAKEFQVASRFSQGEEVIVAFLHNNPGAPVVLGSVFHSKNQPKKTEPGEWLVQCGKLRVRFTESGFEVLIGDSRFGIAAEGITFKGKKITGSTDGHKWEMK